MTDIQDTSENARQQFWTGARENLTLALGASVYGLAFGLLAVEAGYGVGHIGVMSMAVFAGSSQIISSQQLANGAGALAAIIAGLALNLRMCLVTASIRDIYANRPLWQVALGAHLATDENWALMLSTRAKGRNVGYWYFIGGGVCLFVIWWIATVSGVFFAKAIPDPKSIGVDFAFTAAFIAIARSLWKGKRDLLPWLTAVAMVGIAIKLIGIAPSWALILGGISGAITAAFTHE